MEIIRALGKPLPKPPSSPESTRTLSLGSLSPASGALHVREIARVNSTDPAKLGESLNGSGILFFFIISFHIILMHTEGSTV